MYDFVLPLCGEIKITNSFFFDEEVTNGRRRRNVANYSSVFASQRAAGGKNSCAVDIAVAKASC